MHESNPISGIELPETKEIDWGILIEKLKNETGFYPDKIRQIGNGANSRVFKLENESQKPIVAKFYFKDDKRRLEREYEACRFLASHGISVPTPILYDQADYCGFYGFEDGEVKTAESITKFDADQLLNVISKLHSFPVENQTQPFNLAVHAETNMEGLLHDTDRRIEAVKQEITKKETHPYFKEFLRATGILEAVKDITRSVIDQWSGGPWRLHVSDLRFNTGDFGFQNILFRTERHPCLLDLEYSGWDDPLAMIAEFSTHEKTRGIELNLLDNIVNGYCENMQLSDYNKKRLSFMTKLFDIKWLALLLNTCTSPYIQRRMISSNTELSAADYIQSQLKKIEDRYEKIRQL